MLGSMYGNGLVLVGLWVATSLVVLCLWGVLAWAVVTMLSRRGSARNEAGTADCRDMHRRSAN